MRDAATVVLPGGLWLDGIRHQEAGLRPLVGDDEGFLLETGESLLPAQRTTALLTRCVTHLGPLSQVSAETVQSLAVGDREALLLHLRRLTLGDRLQCVLSCPNPACGERMDLELAVGDLLLSPYPHTQERYETTVKENGSAYRVRFRLPTGADQEKAAVLAQSDSQAAVDLVLHCCVESVITDDGDGEPIENWPPAVAQQIPAVMAELDAQAELVLNLSCPVCGHTFSAVFDTAAYFFQELADLSRHLYREIHLLAFYYHWSESEIVGMTARKRRRYLELLTEALAGEAY